MSLRPALITLNNIKYVVPSWKQVSIDTTLVSVTNEWEKLRPKLKLDKIKKFKVSNRPYTITLIKNELFCNCPAGTYRKMCKHVKLFRKDVKKHGFNI